MPPASVFDPPLSTCPLATTQTGFAKVPTEGTMVGGDDPPLAKQPALPHVSPAGHTLQAVLMEQRTLSS
jgi:hypothetical protein